MKQKLTVNTLAFGNLKQRKKQYTFMIIGIILAMVFSSGVLFFVSCMNTSVEMNKKDTFGAQDGIFINADEEVFKKAKEENLVTDYAFAHAIGFGYTDEKENGTSIAYLDDKAKDLSCISFLEGGYPENENEIAVEKSALARLGIDAKIGDTIKLTVLTQNSDAYLSKPVEKSYKLVGIAKNKRSNINSFNYFSYDAIPAAFVYDGAQIEPGGREMKMCYFTVNYETDNYYDNLFSLFEDSGATGERWDLVGYRNSGYAVEMNGIEQNIGFVITFIVVLFIASCMGIINAFNSNLKDRKKQIGMLRTVGATKRQIIIIFGREAFIISLICAPLSVAISYFMVKGVTKLMGDEFVFIPNWWVLILCAVFSVICVMLSALIPLVRAAKISPIQSIRNIEYTRRMKTKRIKTQKRFHTSKLLAKRSIIFNRKGQILVSVILIITIVFSCYGFSSLSAAEDDVYQIPYDYRIANTMSTYYSFGLTDVKNDPAFTENDRQKVLSIPYVDTVNAYQHCNAFLLTDTFSDYMNTMNYFGDGVYSSWIDFADELTPENIDERITAEYSKEYLSAKEKYNIDKNFYPTSIGAYEGSVLEKLKNSVTDGKIDIDKINSGEEIILVAPKEIAFDMKLTKDGGCQYDVIKNDKIKEDVKYFKRASCDYKAGDKIDISVLTVGEIKDAENEVLPELIDKKDKTVTIGAIVSELPDDFYAQGSGIWDDMFFITSLSGMKAFSSNLKYAQFNISLKGECDEEIDREMQEQLQKIADSVNGSDLFSNFGYAQSERQYLKSLFFSMISIVVLFLCISASIINNSLTARIRESKREIGTLRAVGASQRELVDSYIRQLFSIFAWSYLLGFVLFFVSYAVYCAAAKVIYGETPDMNLNVWQTAVACLLLFAVCSINLWLKIRKEMKNSIIDNIREL